MIFKRGQLKQNHHATGRASRAHEPYLAPPECMEHAAMGCAEDTM
jgi:hypothetical protein